jgi:hypothetical protein
MLCLLLCIELPSVSPFDTVSITSSSNEDSGPPPRSELVDDAVRLSLPSFTLLTPSCELTAFEPCSFALVSR